MIRAWTVHLQRVDIASWRRRNPGLAAHTVRLAAVLALASPLGNAWASADAAPAGPSLPAHLTPAENEFTAACSLALSRSVSDAPETWRKGLCNCALRESRESGVQASSLSSEAKQIEADPKHQIKDAKLLEALHVCAIESVRAP